MFCNLHTSTKPINRLCMEKLITKSFTHHFAYAFFFLRDFRTDKHFAWYYEWVLLRWIFGLFLFLFSFLFATLYQYFQHTIFYRAFFFSRKCICNNERHKHRLHMRHFLFASIHTLRSIHCSLSFFTIYF